MISQELYFYVTKMMRPMYAVFSKLKVLTGNMPNEPNHMFSIAEFRDSRDMAARLINTMQLGFLSDPVGVSLYYQMSIDKDGLTIY